MSIHFSGMNRQLSFPFGGTDPLPSKDALPEESTHTADAEPSQAKAHPKTQKAEEEPQKGLPAEPARLERFAPLAHIATPNPIPDKWDFYWSELKANMGSAMRQGGEQYKEALLKDEHTRLKALGMLFATGIGLTVFRRLRRTATFLLFMAILGKPIMVATQTFPKMSEAYEEVKSGNPGKGRQKFRNALDESFYSIFKDFLKPVSYGVMLAYLLEIPFAFRNEGNGIRHHIIRKTADFLRINRNAKPIVATYEKMKPYVHWGDRQANRIRQQLPLLDWIEDPKQLKLQPKDLSKKAQLLLRRGLRA